MYSYNENNGKGNKKLIDKKFDNDYIYRIHRIAEVVELVDTPS
jgi:hypothetical protein